MKIKRIEPGYYRAEGNAHWTIEREQVSQMFSKKYGDEWNIFRLSGNIRGDFMRHFQGEYPTLKAAKEALAVLDQEVYI